ncbi:MAG: adenylate/guanylate cyclase domain-containing protein [Ruegeria sp.]
MADEIGKRRLSAILIADIVGYSKMTAADEDGTLARVRDLTDRIIRPVSSRYSGRLVKTMGDGFLLDFSSAIEAVRAAIEISDKVTDGPADSPDGDLLSLRIGIHIGDVLTTDTDVMGNGVNIAARIESLANPGEIWISSDTYRQVHDKLDATFQDLGPHKLKNMSDPVQIFRISPDPTDQKSRPDPFARPGGSIAVMPFDDEGPDKDCGKLADSLAKDIASGLAHFRDLRVVSSSASFWYRDRNIPAQQAAKELSARYIVEGGVRKLGNRVRMAVGLVDGESGEHLWTHRYDREDADLFALQDEIVEHVVQTLAGRVQAADRKLALSATSTASMSPEVELVHKARAIILDTPEALSECRELYQKALSHNPNYAPALAGLSGIYSFEWTSTWSDSHEETLDKALVLLRKAALMDDQHSEVQRRLGVLHVFRGEAEQARAHLDRALMLNPNDAAAMAYKGLHLIYQGQPKDALTELDRATRCNPFHPTYFHWFAGLAHFMSGRPELAIPELDRAIELFPNFVTPHRHLAACHAQLGNMDKAIAERDIVLALEPDFSINRIARTFQYVNDADKELYCHALRLAGLPD